MLIERPGHSHRAHARPGELSQGDAQRAAIARALVGRSGLIIAAQPTSAFDHGNMGRVAALRREGAGEAGASLLIATHDDRLYDPVGSVRQIGPMAA